MITNPLKHRRVVVPLLALFLVAVVPAAASASHDYAGPNPDQAALVEASQPPADAAPIAHRPYGGGHIAPTITPTQAPVVRPNPDEVGNGPRSVSAAEFAALTQPQAVESNEAFDWGDAGIGAGAALVLTMIGTAFVVTARRQRAPTTA